MKIYTPATKVKKINDNNKDIEIYFSEKSDKGFFSKENGKLFQEDEFDTNMNFERNSSKAKFFRSMMIVKLFIFVCFFILFYFPVILFSHLFNLKFILQILP